MLLYFFLRDGYNFASKHSRLSILYNNITVSSHYPPPDDSFYTLVMHHKEDMKPRQCSLDASAVFTATTAFRLYGNSQWARELTRIGANKTKEEIRIVQREKF